jgi:hypothetical protein
LLISSYLDQLPVRSSSIFSKNLKLFWTLLD